jgi:hypothetical protein
MNIIPLKYKKFTDFLSKDDNLKLLDCAIKNELSFIDSEVLNPETGEAIVDDNFKKAKTLYASEYPKEMDSIVKGIKNNLRYNFSNICEALNIEGFPIKNIKSQCIATPDKGFHKLHSDSSLPEVENRIITYVYYFSLIPKPFEGGELEIYETYPDEEYTDKYTHDRNFVQIYPANNTLVAFNSRSIHGVLPVRSMSKEFKSSRFTIIGWLLK